MSEQFPDNDPYQPTVNRIVVIDALQEIGIDVELADWIDYDDAQILGDLATHSAVLGIGMEDLFEACGIEIDNIGGHDEI